MLQKQIYRQKLQILSIELKIITKYYEIMYF